MKCLLIAIRNSHGGFILQLGGGIVSTWVGLFVFGANDATVNSYTAEA